MAQRRTTARSTGRAMERAAKAPAAKARAAPKQPVTPQIDAEVIERAILALEGTVLEDFQFPLPGDLRSLVKASDLVSDTIEDRLPELLNSVRDRTWDANHKFDDYEFRKAISGFPDCLLVERANPDNVIFEIEAKSWYILSRDTITARFLTDPSVITPGTLVVIAGWVLDGVVAGSPKLLRIHIADARELADARDTAWESQAHRRVVPPENPPGTPRNLRKTQVEGQQKTGSADWRKDSDNFGKLHRIKHPPLKAFIEHVFELQAAGKTFKAWHNFIHG